FTCSDSTAAGSMSGNLCVVATGGGVCGCSTIANCGPGLACGGTPRQCTTSCSSTSPCDTGCCSIASGMSTGTCMAGSSAGACLTGGAQSVCTDCTQSSAGHACLPGAPNHCGCTNSTDC